MEEKRELPEGVKEEMGACIFCGQTYMFANVGLSTEAVKRSSDGEMHLRGSKELAGAAESGEEGTQENGKNLC